MAQFKRDQNYLSHTTFSPWNKLPLGSLHGDMSMFRQPNSPTNAPPDPKPIRPTARYPENKHPLFRNPVVPTIHTLPAPRANSSPPTRPHKRAHDAPGKKNKIYNSQANGMLHGVFYSLVSTGGSMPKDATCGGVSNILKVPKVKLHIMQNGSFQSVILLYNIIFCFYH